MQPRLNNSNIKIHADAKQLPALSKTVFEAAIFDLDGTLINSEGPYLVGLHAALTERGASLQLDEVSQLLYGRSWFDVFRAIETRMPAVFSDVRDLTDAVEFQMHSKEGLEPTLIHSSVRLLSCMAKIVPVSIVSGSSRAQVLKAAATLDIIGDVDHCLGYEDYEAGKPSPSGFKEAARRMDVNASSCVVFEDSGVGVAAARRAGMFCIALARPDAAEQDLSEAHLVVRDLCDSSVLDALG